MIREVLAASWRQSPARTVAALALAPVFGLALFYGLPFVLAVYVEEPEPEPRPGASGCYRDVAVFLLVVVPLVAAALGIAVFVRRTVR
jgi:hypothetical protein